MMETSWILKGALPSDSMCPKCNGSFHLKARTLYRSMMPTAHDELEWLCAMCGYAVVEHRRKADGVDDEWPPSRFQPR